METEEIPFAVGDVISYGGAIFDNGDVDWNVSKIDTNNNRITITRETGNIVVPQESQSLFLDEVVEYVKQHTQAEQRNEKIEKIDENLNTNSKQLNSYMLGAFYEFRGHDADTVASLLNFQVTSRKGENIVGIPKHYYDEVKGKLEAFGYTIDFINENDKHVTVDYSDAFFVNEENQTVRWLYFNPDSDAGGQYVENNLSFDNIIEASKDIDNAHDFFDYLGSIAEQHLFDIDYYMFEYIQEDFLSTPDFKDCTKDTMKGLKEVCHLLTLTDKIEVLGLSAEADVVNDNEEIPSLFDVDYSASDELGKQELKVGDVIELDEGTFKITEIKNGIDGAKYELQDLTVTGWFPIFRNISEDDLYEVGFSLVEEKQAIEPVEKNDTIIENENKTQEFVGGAKAKFKNNIEAIRLLKQIETENRSAAEHEKEILSRYVGWGGIPEAFNPNNPSWQKEYTKLKELLTESEYKAAKASVLDYFYTSPVVIEGIYSALDKFGFKSGNILEPSMGVGNFFKAMPQRMKSDSKLYGVELDSISGRIAQQIYPDADIQVTGYEKTEFEDNFFDVTVGNIPFGNFKVSDRKYDSNNFLIHDYFIAKTLDKVRSGGIVAFVTSTGTLDKVSPQVRKYIAQRAELLGAIRLPNDAFKNAGTKIASDIIFLKKREEMITLVPDWVYTDKDDNGFTMNSCNSYGR